MTTFRQILNDYRPGYEYLLTYQNTVEIYDLTVEFGERFLPGRENLRTREQMVQAARSAKQCIVEGYLQKSTKGYIKLLGVSRGSLEELLKDYEDFARLRGIEISELPDQSDQKNHLPSRPPNPGPGEKVCRRGWLHREAFSPKTGI